MEEPGGYVCVFPLVEPPPLGLTIHKAHLVKVLLALSWSEGRPGRVVSSEIQVR